MSALRIDSAMRRLNPEHWNCVGAIPKIVYMQLIFFFWDFNLAVCDSESRRLHLADVILQVFDGHFGDDVFAGDFSLELIFNCYNHFSL